MGTQTSQEVLREIPYMPTEAIRPQRGGSAFGLALMVGAFCFFITEGNGSSGMTAFCIGFLVTLVFASLLLLSSEKLLSDDPIRFSPLDFLPLMAFYRFRQSAKTVQEMRCQIEDIKQLSRLYELQISGRELHERLSRFRGADESNTTLGTESVEERGTVAEGNPR